MEQPPDEEIEAGADELILLRYSRSWPSAVVEWTRRRRSAGSQSFPVQAGTIKSTANPPDWDAMRAEALQTAGAKVVPRGNADTGRPRRSFLSRLLTRS